jgi:hypothetical protein
MGIHGRGGLVLEVHHAKVRGLSGRVRFLRRPDRFREAEIQNLCPAGRRDAEAKDVKSAEGTLVRSVPHDRQLLFGFNAFFQQAELSIVGQLYYKMNTLTR